MQIRGLTLPTEFVSCIENHTLRRARGSWQLCSNRDAFGNRLEAELGKVYETIRDIECESDQLPRDFGPGAGDFPDACSNEPGFIPYISDFSRILAFAIASDGAPYCFDYRRQPNQPSIIWWDDAYWRRVAPDFVTFLGLFDIKQNV
jgi:hypothetical protein